MMTTPLSSNQQNPLIEKNRTTNVSAAWIYPGTNNSGLPSQLKCAHTIPTNFIWSGSPSLQNTNALPFGNARRSHKRTSAHVENGYTPPWKIHVTPEKVAHQFNLMSLQQSSEHDLHNYDQCMPEQMEEMWQKYRTIEKQLQVDDIDEVDEGVDMAGDTETMESSNQTLHICSRLQARLQTQPVPDILVPRASAYQVVLWKPPQNLVDKIGKSKDDGDIEKTTPVKARRKANSFSALDNGNKTSGLPTREGPDLLRVPAVRPDTPPPNISTTPISEDLRVGYCEDAGDMDL